MARHGLNPSQRFWAKVKITSEHECWLWQEGTTNGGYGTFGAAGRMYLAHRWAYEHMVGPIPEGLHIDHLCRVRRCVNPSHLEPVTSGENTRRAHAARATCKNGHPWTEAITFYYKGQRRCRECARAADRKRRAKRTAGVQRRKAGRTHCANGHPWVAENLYTDPRGYTTCRPCVRDRMRAYRSRGKDIDESGVSR